MGDGFGDFDGLHFGHAEFAHFTVWRQGSFKAFQQLLRLPAKGLFINPAKDARGRLLSHENIFRNSHLRERQEFLVNHGDA